MIALIVVAWLACGVLAFGITVAYFWCAHPILQSRLKFREDCGAGGIFALMGPVGLLVALLCSGFAYRGLMYRLPRDWKKP